MMFRGVPVKSIQSMPFDVLTPDIRDAGTERARVHISYMIYAKQNFSDFTVKCLGTGARRPSVSENTWCPWSWVPPTSVYPELGLS